MYGVDHSLPHFQDCKYLVQIFPIAQAAIVTMMISEMVAWHMTSSFALRDRTWVSAGPNAVENVKERKM
jgi:hypothetical protein